MKLSLLKDKLVLAKKKNNKFWAEKEEKAFILGVTETHSANKEVYHFYSDQHESLYWDLSVSSLATYVM
jgi:hypothetical protein